LAVWLFCVVDSQFANTATKALPPASDGLGSPARLGKLLHRNAEPPKFSAHAPLGPLLPISVTPEITVLFG
jgi:hypothetical protein